MAGGRGQIRLAPPPVDARWDPSTLPTEDGDEEPRWSELQLASRDGDIQRVVEILSGQKDDSLRLEIVNQPAVGYYGQTALQAACVHGHETIARILLEAGADLNAPGGNNIYRNAFELACGTGDCPSHHRTIAPTRATNLVLQETLILFAFYSMRAPLRTRSRSQDTKAARRSKPQLRGDTRPSCCFF
ncbi:hypothetical protein BX600DRAFT_55346 [Xylariales sp. PMI_506]|nr:hypothetical protein BX600DRAFT_55346 [Xylariales sp. PMI_506]